MPRPKIISEQPITMAAVSSQLAIIKKRDGELNFRANKTDEYLNQLNGLDLKKAEELKQKIDKLGISRLKEDQITKIIDLLPTSVEELKVILQGYTLTLNKDNAKKIIDVVKEFVV